MILILSADNNFIQHTSVTVRSVLDNASKPELLNIKLLCDNISGKNLAKFKKSLTDYESIIRLDIIDVNQFPIKAFNPLSNVLSKSAYHRIYISEFLEDYSGRVVYLDSDIIVRHDICKLFSEEIGDYTIGAVQNEGLRHQKELGMPPGKVFFNSGIMLIDLEKWRKREILPKLEKFISEKNDSLKYADQDALNAIMHDDWYPLNPKWNLHLYFILAPHKCNCDWQLLSDAIDDPAIVHFTTRDKPWYYMTSHPYKKEYYKYLKRTAWADYTPPDWSMRNFFVKNNTTIQGFLNHKIELARTVFSRNVPDSYKSLLRQLRLI